ncbi:acyl-CoA dehydrogenase family protein [Pseudomonas aeruginosa]|jgi:3-hydroxy-9,10-secoandrosta-1,3,5(10)-triene-9,17-dione monooxygenase|nr:acyl-CoA dehydrogenase family protein [Pseudomonas aeruginosa]MCS9139072.1 acyl-CoA dehydrogenase family protein [Pseudomonas aeruginosa]MCS9211947.1 acyl-CoA dehydrogenase family protein [Pseudomonas aeruginosa]
MGQIEQVITHPTAEELVARAQAMVPWLREQAEAVEDTRSVPASTIEAFRDAGFFRILQPTRWGGYAMSPEVLYRVLMELGRGCPSSAWNMMILGIHQWEFGKLDVRAGDELWSEDSTILVASSYAPCAKVQKVDGGWMISGQWPTSSGSEHAAGGAFLGGRVLNEQGKPVDMRAFLVRREDYELIDDWYAVGLAGTGSRSLRLRGDTFVPEHRSHSIVDYKIGDTVASYRLPFNQIFFGAVSSVIVGFANGMVDLFVEHMVPRQNIFVPGAPAQNPFVQEKLGNAVLLIRSARARILQDIQESMVYAERGELVPLDLRVHYFLDGQGVARDCFSAGHMIFKKSSARGVFLKNPLQRQLRALLVGANHITQNEDDTSAMLGAYLLGQGLPPGIFELPAIP